MYRRKDAYYMRAKREGYRSRASYKLIQINRRFRVIRRGDLVLDLGSAPGGWSQVASGIATHVFAVDIREMDPIEGVTFLRHDVFSPELPERILEMCGRPFDVILSDMSPDLTGNYSMDHARSVHLAERVLELCDPLLKKGGRCVVKVFEGDLLEDLLKRYREGFATVKRHSPPASRRSSSEIYLICWNWMRIH